MRPTCLTIRLKPSLRALDRPVWMARIKGSCQLEIVLASWRISGTEQAAQNVGRSFHWSVYPGEMFAANYWDESDR